MDLEGYGLLSDTSTLESNGPQEERVETEEL